MIYSTCVAVIVWYCRPRLSLNPWWNRGGEEEGWYRHNMTQCAPRGQVSDRLDWLLTSRDQCDYCVLNLQAGITECIWWSMPCHTTGGLWHWKSKYKDQVKYESDWVYRVPPDKSIKIVKDKQFSEKIYWDVEKIQVTGDWHSRSGKTCWCSYPNKRDPIRKSGIFIFYWVPI